MMKKNIIFIVVFLFSIHLHAVLNNNDQSGSLFEMKEKLKIFQTEKQRKENYSRYIIESLKTTTCINQSSDFSVKMGQLDIDILKLKEDCLDKLSSVESGYINCLQLTQSLIPTVEYLISLSTKNTCGFGEKSISSLNEVLLLLNQESSFSVEKYKQFLIEEFRAHREEVLKRINNNSRLFNCEMKMYADYSKMIALSSKAKVEFYTGDLYELNNVMKTIEALQEKIEITGRICKLDNHIKIEESRIHFLKLKKRFNSLTYQEASKKACRILTRKQNLNKEIEILCAKPVDTQSYRFSINRNLDILVKRKGDL